MAFVRARDVLFACTLAPVACALALVASPLSIVRAQDASPTETAIPETEEDAETAMSLVDAEARSVFEAGRAAFADARYADALGYFERAHELSGRHQLLYNIGLCHDRLGHDAEALTSFERYLEEAPEAHNRAEVEQRLETARERVARGTPVPTPALPSRDVDVGAWAVLGAGIAVAVSGAAPLLVGRLDIAAIEASPDGVRAWSDTSAEVERADALTVSGSVLLGVGAVTAVLGAVWASSAGQETPAAALLIGPGSISLRGTF